MKKKKLMKEFSRMLVSQADGCNEDNLRIYKKIEDLAGNWTDVFNALKEIVDKHKNSTATIIENLQEELDSYRDRMGPDQAEFNRYKTAVAKMFERKSMELRSLFDKHDSAMISKLNAFNGIQDQLTGFEKFTSEKFDKVASNWLDFNHRLEKLAAQLAKNTESVLSLQEEFTDFVSGEELQEQIDHLKAELHSARELWHHRTSVEILQQENTELKMQLANLSENFDCLNNTVNEIMKREAIRDRGIKIPCPSTDEYDQLMDIKDKDGNVFRGTIFIPTHTSEPKQPSIEIVVATDRNGVIGVDGKIPWDCPEDRKFFKELTEGHVVVMGRKTYESLPEKFKLNGLPDRENIVMTRNSHNYKNNTNLSFFDTSPEDIIDYVISETEGMKIFIIGGEEIYKLWLPYVDVIHHSQIATEINTELAHKVSKFEFVDADWGCPVDEVREGFTYYKLIAMPGAK